MEPISAGHHMRPVSMGGVVDGGRHQAPGGYETEAGGGLTRSLCYLAACCVGILRTTTIQLIGAMPVGEFLLIGVCFTAAFALVIRRRLTWGVPAPQILGLFVIGQLVGIGGYVLSDLWRESAPVDMIRGWLRMVFVLIDMIALAILCGVTERAFVWLQAGVAMSFAQLLMTPPLFGDYWKFGFAYPVTMMVFLMFPHLAGFWGGVVGAVAIGALHAALDFRSLGAECVATAALLLLRILPKRARIAIMVATALGALLCSPMIVEKMFSSEGERANRSNVERSAMLQSAWEGFLRSPLVGQGSWFSKSEVMDQFLLIRAEKAQAAGGGMQFQDDDFEGIAIHSQIVVSLAEGGVLGGTFFILYGVLVLWAIWFAVIHAAWAWTLPSRLLLLVLSFFNLWMSPFSGPIRVEIAGTVILVTILWSERSRNTKSRAVYGTDNQYRERYSEKGDEAHQARPQSSAIGL